MKNAYREYDLRAAADEMINIPKFSDLSKLIKKRTSLLSIGNDLNIAVRMLNLGQSILDEVSEEKIKLEKSEMSLVLGSILTQAILIYCAATHTQSIKDNRWLVGLRGASTDIRDAHKRICGVRDQAIGHFGDAKDHLEGPWTIDKLALTLTEGGFQTSICSYRTTTRLSVSKDLILCINFTQNLIKERTENEINKFNYEIEKF